MFLNRLLGDKLAKTPTPASCSRAACMRRPPRRVCLQLMRLEDRCVPSVDLMNHFAGMNETGAGFVTPPDSDVAAGPAYVIHTTNSASPGTTATQGFEILTKSGQAVVEESINQFFQSVYKPGDLTTDPRVVFNNINNQFLVVLQESDAAGNSYLDYALSNDANPLDGFRFFQLNVTEVGGAQTPDKGDQLFADYPTLGFNAGGFFVTQNMFDNTNGFDHVQIVSLTSSGKSYINDRPYQQDFTLDPLRWHTSTDANVEWFVENDVSEFQTDVGGTLRFVQMTNPFSTSPSYTDSTVTVPPFVDASVTSLAQPDQPLVFPVAPQKLDSRMMDAAMQGNTLVAAQTVNTSFTKDVTDLTQFTDRVRWYQFQMPTLSQASSIPVLQQTGDIAPAQPFPDASTYTPAIEIAPNGNIGVTFLESSSVQFISMYVTGRQPTDPSGTMEKPVAVANGNSVDYLDGRVGDNAGISIDPANGSFWAANERYTNIDLTPNWQTWIANFTIGSQTTPPGTGGGSGGHHHHGHNPHGGSRHGGDHARGSDAGNGDGPHEDSGDLYALGTVLQKNAHRLDLVIQQILSAGGVRPLGRLHSDAEDLFVLY